MSTPSPNVKSTLASIVPGMEYIPIRPVLPSQYGKIIFRKEFLAPK